MRSPPHEERSPDELQLGEASGIEELPRRVNRYGQAKKRALDVAEYIESVHPGWSLARRVSECGDYLVFRHYYTRDLVRLHAAQFCKKHLLCPLCAIRRGSKALEAYLPRYEAVLDLEPLLRPFLVTLTVKDGPDLAERFRHLQRAQHELWKRKHRRRGSSLAGVRAAVWSYEVKLGSGSGLWHPHLHMVALAEIEPDAGELAAEWHAITGDSYIVDVRPIDQADPASGFFEVFKYALKFSDMEPAETFEASEVLKGKRLVASSGLFRGIEIPEELTDEPLDDLPFVELFYRYLNCGYSFSGRRDGVIEKRVPRAPWHAGRSPVKRGLGREPQRAGEAAGASSF